MTKNLFCILVWRPESEKGSQLLPNSFTLTRKEKEFRRGFFINLCYPHSSRKIPSLQVYSSMIFSQNTLNLGRNFFMSNSQLATVFHRTNKKKKGNFTQIDNEIIHNKSLSIGARMILIHMLSKPDGFQFYIETIQKELGFGSKNTVSKHINELILAGYVQRKQIREHGKFVGYQYTVNEFVSSVQNQDDEQADEPIKEAEDGKKNNPILVPADSQNLIVEGMVANNTDSSNTILKERQNDKGCAKQSAYMDSSFVPNSIVPVEFIDTIKPFFGDADTIFKFWGKCLLAHKNMGEVHPNVDVCIDAIKRVVFMYRNKRIKGDVFGYFYSTVCTLISKSKRTEVPNWLEE